MLPVPSMPPSVRIWFDGILPLLTEMLILKGCFASGASYTPNKGVRATVRALFPAIGRLGPTNESALY